MKIAGHDTQKKVFIVAEAGVNHEGNFQDALALVDAAKRAGADAVKFQTFLPAEYIAKSEVERFARVSKFALPLKDFERLHAHAAKIGITLFSTPLDPESVKALNAYVPVMKISSGDMDFRPLVQLIAAKRKPIIFSTGTATPEDVKNTLRWIKMKTSAAFVRDKVAVLHCVAAYPAAPESVNLNTLAFLKEEFGLTVGYSDHTPGIEVCPLAVAAGARIIEKHFTLSREGKVFRDHYISLEPQEFRQMVDAVRRVETLLGRPGKIIAPEEITNTPHMRRGIAVRRPLAKGTVLKSGDLLFVRPQRDFKYNEAAKLVGRKLIRDLGEGCLISRGDLTKP